jgi:hypothetical protein
VTKTSLITFSDEKFENKKNFTNELLRDYFDVIKNYSPADINYQFIKENIDIYSKNKGFGYWLWKPYIVLDYLNNHCDDGDIVVYCDSGDYIFKDSLKQAFDFLKNKDCLFIKSDHPNSKYIKRDCFVFMDCDEEKYWNNTQVYASVFFLKKTQEVIDIIQQWQNYCKNSNILTDSPNISGKTNFVDFVDHRHDQAILTNLVIKHDLPTKQEVSSSPWIIK